MCAWRIYVALWRRNYLTNYECPPPPNPVEQDFKSYLDILSLWTGRSCCAKCCRVWNCQKTSGTYRLVSSYFPTCREKPEYHNFGNTDRANLRSCIVSAVLSRNLFLISHLCAYYVETIILWGTSFTRTTNSSCLPLRNMLSPILAESRRKFFAFVPRSYSHSVTFVMQIISTLADRSSQLCTYW